jgi:beta-mannanase
MVSSFDNVTGTTVTCLGAYGSDQTWSDWTDPWLTGPAGAGYTSWVAQDPQVRQMVLGISLIPASIQDSSDPSGWEQSCAAGNFDNYAAELGTNLVAAGLQNSVIRLAWEMNGPWEGDFVGSTTQDQSLWVTCFDNEVTALRSAAGEHFLIDWNPNSCTETIPYANYYPGNAYVNIVGLDFYDVSCDAPNTQVSFAQLAAVPSGLNNFEAFAAAQGKPMSFPEWGLDTTPNGDDPGYIAGVGAAVANGNFAFEEYFQVADGVMQLGSSTPLSNAQFEKSFG